MTVAVEAAETDFPALLEQIERGDHVQLHRNGQTVATLSPISEACGLPQRTPEQVAHAQAAMDRMDARAKSLGLKFDFNEFKVDKEFGRR